MSNAFNPFPPPAPPVQAQPVQQPAAIARPQRPIAQSLSEASENDGFSTRFLLHLDGNWDLKITGYVGARTPMLGIAVHITFEVIKSSTPDAIPVGSVWRVAYKYDYDRQTKADKDTYASDAATLSRFIKALFAGVDLSAPGAIEAAEHSLHSHDWTTQPGFVHLNGQLGKEKIKTSPTGGTEKRRFRNDYWFPYKAA